MHGGLHRRGGRGKKKRGNVNMFGLLFLVLGLGREGGRGCWCVEGFFFLFFFWEGWGGGRGVMSDEGKSEGGRRRGI